MSRQDWTVPADNETREYQIYGVGLYGILRVRYTGVPPCLYCGTPVTSPSMDGPLVCGPCDMGRNPDGTSWSRATHSERRAHREKVLADLQKSPLERLAEGV